MKELKKIKWPSMNKVLTLSITTLLVSLLVGLASYMADSGVIYLLQKLF